VGPKKVLFCTDFSENSRPAWQHAVEYAQCFGAQLLILHVLDYKDFPGYVDWLEKLREILLEHEQACDMRIQEWAKEAAPKVKDVKAFCRMGDTAQMIVNVAKEESVDMIVMGTHGHTGVKHLVMGSVARSVLKMAHLPVLIVQGPTEEGETYGRTK